MSEKTAGGKSAFSKRTLVILISTAIYLLFFILPAPAGLSRPAMQVLGIFLSVLLLWLTIDIDWPSLVCLALLAFVPGIKFNTMISESIGGSTFSFLLFTFLCTYALSKTPFVRRCALAFVNSKIARRGPWSFVLLFFLSNLILGSFMSPSVLFVIYLPIIEEIYAILKLEKTDKLANMLMMGMTITIGISSGITPIAHVFGIMAMGFYETATKKAISYAHYIMACLPVGILTFIAMLLLFRFVLRPDMSKLKDVGKLHIADDTGPMDLRGKLILLIFGTVVFFWVAPGLIEGAFPAFAKSVNAFGTSLPPLIGAALMMIITVGGKPLLDFKEGMSKGVSWASLIMGAATLALGAAMTNKSIGLIDYVTKNIAPGLSTLAPLVLVFVFMLWAAVQTNLSSNMVTITVVCAVAIPLCLASGGKVSTPAVAALTGMLGAFAFAAPPAHPNVALASASGWTTATQMLLYGALTMIVSVFFATFVGYPLAAGLMGF